jgi:hypothetical protein
MRRVKVFGLLSCLVAVFGSLLWAKGFWENKRYTQWTPNEVEEMLTNSPWVQVQTFAEVAPSNAVQVPQVPATGEPTRPWGVEGSPGTSERVEEAAAAGRFRVYRKYYARFQSAVPVRMALAQKDLLAKSIRRNQAEQYVRSSPFDGKIVVAIGVPQGQDPSELHRVTTDLLSSSTYLLLGKSKRRIPLERYLPPTQATRGEGLLIFPRQEGGQALVTLREKEVSLICQLSEAITLNYQFKLTEMVFGGELQL